MSLRLVIRWRRSTRWLALAGDISLPIDISQLLQALPRWSPFDKVTDLSASLLYEQYAALVHCSIMHTHSLRDLAQQLLATEAAIQSATDAHTHEAVRVCDKLRRSLIRLAGADSFAALLRRSLALARTEVHALARVTVMPDCTMEGLEELASDATGGGVDGPVAITTHLLGLLVTFIGEPLTLRLVREAWPDVSLE